MFVFCNRKFGCVLLSRGYEKRPTVMSVFEFSIKKDTCPLFEDDSSSLFSKQITFERICAIRLCVVQKKKLAVVPVFRPSIYSDGCHSNHPFISQYYFIIRPREKTSFCHSAYGYGVIFRNCMILRCK